MQIGGDIRLDDLSDFCDSLNALLLPSSASDLTLDLSSVDDICPAALAALIATLRRRALIHPDSDVAYLPPAAAHLQRWLGNESVKALTLRATGRRPATSEDDVGFDGCEPFSDGEGITRAVYALRASLEKRVEIPIDTLGSMGAMLDELTGNVIQHASGGRDGTAAAAYYPEENQIELAVADRGAGILRTLSRNPQYASLSDDRAAIECALEPLTTGDTTARGGLGLFLARTVVANNEGLLVVRSGTATVAHPRDTAAITGLPSFGGTVIAVRIRLDRPFDYAAVEDKLWAPEGIAT